MDLSADEEVKEQLDLPQLRRNEYIEEVKEGPYFTQKEHVKDANGRRPDEPDYDPSTLFIDKADWKKLTDGMKRYWEIKAKNFDKIVLYRFGEWFIVYY